MKAEKKFIQVQKELKPYQSIMGRAADAVIEQNVSSYPIFVVHQLEVAIGIPILVREELDSKWSVNISSLEEFATKQIIDQDKLEEFKKVYKDPEQHFCLFLLNDFGATFVFLPRVG